MIQRVPQQPQPAPLRSKLQKKTKGKGKPPAPQPPQKQTSSNPNPPPPRVTPSSNDFNLLDSEGDDEVGDDEEEDEDYFCIYCQDKPRTHVLLPCLHLIACGECIQIFSPGILCPLCSCAVSSTRKCVK
jgi:hypothetical protein